ncbi:hypothetical protein BDV37DRAFT_265482 [Aspergillus pseudonomiae]|uniref:Uncharacterized protein n=1 Tax=Aspergillus pseudonomiae TaxID=1506151 RepID=A0A5N7CTL7_9EURO|nr:uncharacterized protein BDV37DRAFT_265482 [Aspergillus pseudonomiae]KAE8397515.1 hypothetical protein BDV37DRAFT_265482 [Aspergillus pseudonomiae]
MFPINFITSRKFLGHCYNSVPFPGWSGIIQPKTQPQPRENEPPSPIQSSPDHSRPSQEPAHTLFSHLSQK